MRRALSLLVTVGLVTAGLAGMSCVPGELPVAELYANGPEAPLDHASNLTMSLEWQPLRPLEPTRATPFLFVHLLDREGQLLRTFDREIPEAWLGKVAGGGSGEAEIEIWQSALAAPLPAGWYRLTAGVYDLGSGRRWRLETSAREIDEGEYEIAEIEVASAGRRTPDLLFDGDWLVPEEGGRHNPGRRWMGESGTIGLRGTAGWHELVLSISITDLSAGRHLPILEDGATDPRLIIRNGCDHDAKILFEGYGVRSAVLRIDAEDACTITFLPNFTMLDLDDYTHRSIGLESAFFRSKKSQPLD